MDSDAKRLMVCPVIRSLSSPASRRLSTEVANAARPSLASIQIKSKPYRIPFPEIVMVEQERPKGKIAIIGCGLIGSCWGAMFASAGYTISVYEVNESLVQAGIGRIRGNLNTMQKTGLTRGPFSTDEAMENVSGTVSLKEALKDAIFAQESTMESEQFKRDIFERMEEAADPTTILASSTSTIPASSFTENLKNRNRCLVVHPVNPPLYLTLTEVVPAPWTDAETTRSTLAILRSIGQTPVQLRKEVLGFAVNRLQYALLAEAWRLVKDGVLDAEAVDLVVSEGLGPRYAFHGPLHTIHLNACGVADYSKRYAAGIRRVIADFGAPPTFDEPDVVQTLEESFSARVPDHAAALDDRTAKLARLAKLKKE